MTEISKKALSEAELLKEIYKKLAGDNPALDLSKAQSKATLLRAIANVIDEVLISKKLKLIPVELPEDLAVEDAGHVAIDSTDFLLKYWDGTQWIILNIKAGNNSSTSHKVIPSALPNGLITEDAGLIVFDNSDSVLKCWDGTAWKALFA
ncbi:MAG: hypothetical protein PF694_09210 [Bacteroidetes bacterium]|jgi:hypothetical protein|nr:hypothetical protein [Bacteroidota bacterium]